MAKFLSTGQIAKICEVAPRTAQKWCDEHGLQHVKLPGSGSRRVRSDWLHDYLKEHGYPAETLEEVARAGA